MSNILLRMHCNQHFSIKRNEQILRMHITLADEDDVFVGEDQLIVPAGKAHEFFLGIPVGAPAEELRKALLKLADMAVMDLAEAEAKHGNNHPEEF